MQTLVDKQEEIAYNKGRTYPQMEEYIERCFRTYPLESYYSYIKEYVNYPQKILEMCCGNGFFSFFIEQKTRNRVLGLDISREFTENANIYAANRGYGSWFQYGDAENTIFYDDWFDVVIMFDALHHFPVTEDVLREVHRVQKTNGLFIFFEPNPSNPYVAYSVLKGKIQNGSYGYDHEKMFSGKHYINALNSSGFDIIERKTIRYIPKTMIDRSKLMFNLDRNLSSVPFINNIGFSTFMVSKKR